MPTITPWGLITPESRENPQGSTAKFDALIQALANSIGKRYSVVGQSSAIVNTTTPTAFDKFVTLAAGDINAQGTLLHVVAHGVHSTTGTPTLTLTSLIDGTSHGARNRTCGTVTNAPWTVDAWYLVRSTGGSGVIALARWHSPLNGATTGIDGACAGGQPVTITKNLAGALELKTLVTWGTASASNTIIQEAMFVEVMPASSVIT